MTRCAATGCGGPTRTTAVAEGLLGPGGLHDVLAATGPPVGEGHDPASAHPLTVAAERLARDVLAPAAEAVDRSTEVPGTHLSALAGAGLLGLSGPSSHGGHQAPRPVVRSVYEALAAACGATFFVWVQHHAPVRLLAASPNEGLRDELLADLCSGRRLGAVAFAHLRRDPVPLVASAGPGGGLVLDGEAPWVTSWGMAATVAVGAQLGNDKVVFVALPAQAGPGLEASVPLALAAMGATRTVRLRFDGLSVPASRVICTVDRAEWRERDRAGAAQPHPAAFGVAGAATSRLVALAPETAAALEAERIALRARSYETADEAADHPPSDDPSAHEAADRRAAWLGELVELRARSLELAIRATTALVVASGGRAMSLDHPAQRLVREAAFYTIQAQTASVRQATLGLLMRGVDPRT